MISDEKRLRRECEVFCRYLSGLAPDAYVLNKYCDAHQRVRALHVAAGFDRFLVRFAIANPTLTRLADSYARFLAPTSTFRKKLVLLLAILESSASCQRFLEHVDGGGKLWLGIAALANGGIFAVSLLLGAVVLFPAQLALGFGSTPVEN